MKTDYAGVHEAFYRQRETAWTGDDAPVLLADRVRNALLEFGYAPPLDVLEAGCGTGACSHRLAGYGYRVQGIDIAPAAVEIAQKRESGAKFTVGNVLALPWPDGAFSVVVDAFCLHCLVGDDRNTFLREARRVLKPGGVLVGSTMTGDPPDPQGMGFDPVTRTIVRGGIHVRYLGREEAVRAEIGTMFRILYDHSAPAAKDENAALFYLAVK